jgi:hypothetical protein
MLHPQSVSPSELAAPWTSKYQKPESEAPEEGTNQIDASFHSLLNAFLSSPKTEREKMQQLLAPNTAVEGLITGTYIINSSCQYTVFKAA